MKPVDSSGGLNQVLALRQQVLERNDALQALQAKGEAGATSDTASPGKPANSFAETLGSAINEVSASQQRASDLAAAYERGEVTDVAQVMLARQEAGVAFEATLQVRNKLLSAYQDIMRMGA